MLPDYGGPFFQHQKNKLVQLDIRDIDNELIAPWNMYDKLRPGTVVLVVATLVVWVMHEVEDDPESPLKKVRIMSVIPHHISDKRFSTTTFAVIAFVSLRSLEKPLRSAKSLPLLGRRVVLRVLRLLLTTALR